MNVFDRKWRQGVQVKDLGISQLRKVMFVIKTRRVLNVALQKDSN